MKKTVIKTIILVSGIFLFSCSSSNNGSVEKEDTEIMETDSTKLTEEQVIEVETKSEEVSDSTEAMTDEVKSLSNDVDSLLSDI